MFNSARQTLAALLIATGALAVATAAQAGSDAKGIWLDHTGRGAVEIKDCDGKLCGHVVWVQQGEPEEACGRAIIGDVKLVGDGKWDEGWIYDPEMDSEFDVEITPMDDGKLQVMGYAGIKTLSETMIWTRAPADLKRCVSVGTVAVAD